MAPPRRPPWRSIMAKELTHFIGGKAVSGKSGRFSDVYTPATGEVTGRLPLANAAEVDAAVQSAKKAFPSWAKTPPLTRARVMFKYKELLEKNRDKLARMIGAEHGKVLGDATGEVTRGIEVVEFACGIPHLLKGEFTENVGTNVDAYSVRQPLGVCAGITPFNFPAMVPMWMFPIAIACGNTFVLKPSEKDPGASVLLAELLAEAGLPDGVFNVVQGDKAAVDAILAHPGIAAVSFVGSTPIARHVYATAAAHGKRVQALGGAKNHMLVLPDADLDAAADAAVSAGYGSAGERCMAVSAVIAVGPAGDELVSRIGQRAQQLVVGPGTDPGAQMGPLITGAHRDRVASYLEPGRTACGEVLLDGRGLQVAGYEGGFWLGPSLVDKVRPGTPVYDDEVFGPVLCVLRASSFEEGLEIINASPYGNGAAIFTGDGGAARRFGAEVTAGMVGVNVPIPVPMSYYSFGGWKDSLFGDLHIYGPDGVRFYTRGKVTTSRWREPADVNLAFPSSS